MNNPQKTETMRTRIDAPYPKSRSVTQHLQRAEIRPLIGRDGQPRWGRILPLPSDINWRDFDWRTAMGSQRAQFSKRFGFKHFEFYGVQTPDMIFGCGLVRLGLVNLAFCYVFDRASRTLSEWSRLMPLDHGLQADTRPLGCTRYELGEARITTTRTAQSHTLEFSIGSHRRGKIAIDTFERDVVGLCTPIANTGFAYAQKTAGTPVEGFINWDAKVYPVKAETAGACHDWTAGYLRRETCWRWVCATGVLGSGETFCLNASCGVNETSYSENGFWIDGQFSPIGLVQFHFDRNRPDTAPWTITSSDGRLELRFKPIGAKREHQNRLIMASRFTQCFGDFSGHLVDDNGDLIDLSGLSGWCEDHYAKW